MSTERERERRSLVKSIYSRRDYSARSEARGISRLGFSPTFQRFIAIIPNLPNARRIPEPAYHSHDFLRRSASRKFQARLPRSAFSVRLFFPLVVGDRRSRRAVQPPRPTGSRHVRPPSSPVPPRYSRPEIVADDAIFATSSHAPGNPRVDSAGLA